jgi:predicted nuclease of predicted toxin-antitoxin system
MPLSPELASRLPSLGHDAVHASELSMSRAADELILAAGTTRERVIVTADLDFPRLFSQVGAASPGLVLLRGGNYSEAESIECVRRVAVCCASRGTAAVDCGGRSRTNQTTMAANLKCICFGGATNRAR